MAWKQVLAGTSLVVFVLVSYLPATHGNFLWDDDMYVSENPTLRSGDGLQRIWGELGATPQYYPLVFTSFWVESRLWNMNPEALNSAPFHWDNLLLHGINAVLLWLILRRLAVPGTWFAGALFALHPVEVESVAWITERKNLLSAFFYGLSMLAYLKFALPTVAKPEERGGWSWYPLSLGLFLCALFSKTVACSLPAALVLILWWKRGRVAWKDWLALLPFFGLGLALGMVTVWMERNHVQAQGDEWNFGLVGRCLIAGRAVWFYAGKLLWPAHLTFIYPRWSIDAGAAWQYVFPLAALAVMGTLWLARHKLGRGPLVAVLFFGGTLVPALGFFNIYPQRFSFVADHFQYLASTGLLALAAAAAASVLRRLPSAGQWFAMGAAGVLLLLLGTLTWRQCAIFESQEALWTDTVIRNPESWVAHCNVARLLTDKGMLSEAEQHLRKAIDLHPAPWEAYFSLALIQQKQGDLAAAEGEFTRALQLNPHYVFARMELGSMLLRENRLAEAVEQFRQVVGDNPDFYPAHQQLGLAMLRLGNPKEAVLEYARAVQLHPRDAALRYGLGIARYQIGDRADADVEFRAAERVDPHWPQAAREAAWTLATHPDKQTRNGTLAVQLAQRACDATQNAEPLYLDTLAAAQAEAGKFEQAAATARKALQSKAGLSPELEHQIKERLALYEAKQPFREKLR